ncbi:Phage repressor [Streptococcus oralis]|uniref:Phage repressor n=1 Tax=Streptococcus oralis TaxID=1303 RepID=A0A139RFX3_STROR|nr:helix-turn-helix domain-containing protein [Streptococcus oralis]KXU13652.1 Phage repressor [Streptococcus oralis]
MNSQELALYTGNKIKEYRKQKGWSQIELAEKLDVGKSTIANYEKGYRTPRQRLLFKIADLFNTSIDDFFPSFQKETPDHHTQRVADTMERLTASNRQNVAQYALEQLEKQLTSEISEPLQLYTVHPVSSLSAGRGFAYDDNDIKAVTVDEEPPRHEIASMVSGDSMLPDYENGDIVYLIDKGLSRFSGQVCAVVVDDETYIKKVYTEPKGLRLVSINPAYSDKFIEIPPQNDTHIKIFHVIGSAKPIAK